MGKGRNKKYVKAKLSKEAKAWKNAQAASANPPSCECSDSAVKSGAENLEVAPAPIVNGAVGSSANGAVGVNASGAARVSTKGAANNLVSVKGIGGVKVKCDKQTKAEIEEYSRNLSAAEVRNAYSEAARVAVYNQLATETSPSYANETVFRLIGCLNLHDRTLSEALRVSQRQEYQDEVLSWQPYQRLAYQVSREQEAKKEAQIKTGFTRVGHKLARHSAAVITRDRSYPTLCKCKERELKIEEDPMKYKPYRKSKREKGKIFITGLNCQDKRTKEPVLVVMFRCKQFVHHTKEGYCNICLNPRTDQTIFKTPVFNDYYARIFEVVRKAMMVDEIDYSVQQFKILNVVLHSMNAVQVLVVLKKFGFLDRDNIVLDQTIEQKLNKLISNSKYLTRAQKRDAFFMIHEKAEKPVSRRSRHGYNGILGCLNLLLLESTKLNINFFAKNWLELMTLILEGPLRRAPSKTYPSIDGPIEIKPSFDGPGWPHLKPELSRNVITGLSRKLFYKLSNFKAEFIADHKFFKYQRDYQFWTRVNTLEDLMFAINFPFASVE